MRKFRNRRRFLGALACGVLVLGASWLPAQAGNGEPKKCDEASARGNENSRKNCPPPSTTTSSSSTTTSTSTTSTTSTTTTTMPFDTLVDEVNDDTGTVFDTVEGTSQEGGIEYPDLIPDVRETYVDYTYVWNEEGTAFTAHPMLYFDTWAQNVGNVNLDLMSDDVTDIESPPVSQCISWNGDLCRQREPVGGFVVHPGHGHMHFDDFAGYSLRRLQADGTPDYSGAGLVAVSDKVSFCLLDLQRQREDADRTASYVVCNAVREGISAGWADVYGSDLDGQNLPLTGLADGRYALVIDMNTARNVFETSYTNNRVVITVEIDSTGEWPTATIVGRSHS